MVVLAGLALAPATPAFAQRETRPEIKRCADLEPLEDGQIGRTRPAVLPRDFARITRITRDRLAISTMGGSTICVDMRIKGEVSNFALSPDQRFFSFDWEGYEADGHVIVDRMGAGLQIDTGNPPVFSPSRRRFAAVHQSEAAFSDLEGFGVWQLTPTTLQKLANVTNIPEMVDWKIDSWQGEDCLMLSAIPFSRVPEDQTNYTDITRDRFIAKPYGRTWRVTKATARGCAA
jgi:hypothetical protein